MQLQSKLKAQLVQLDVIRGLAIIGVFLFHLYGATFPLDQLPFSGNFRDYSKAPNLAFFILSPYQYGYLGVTLFFILSGFCIHLSFLRYCYSLKEKGITFKFKIFLKDFFIRRLFRIYPAYFIALLVFSFVSFVFKVDNARPLNLDGVGILNFFSHLLLIHNFSNLSFFGINPAFWSIAVEFQLYIIYPLFLILRNKLNITKATLVIFIFNLFFSPLALELDNQIHSIGNCIEVFSKFCLLIRSLNIFSYSPFYYWFTWVIGAYLVEKILFNNKKTLNLNFKHKLLLLIIFIISHEYKPFSSIGGFAIILLFASLIEEYIIERKNIGFIEKNLAKIGLCSYSIYLFHQPLILWTRLCIHKLIKLIFNFDFQYIQYPYLICTLGAVALFIPIFLISWLSYKYLEIPTHKLGRDFAKYVTNYRN